MRIPRALERGDALSSCVPQIDAISVEFAIFVITTISGREVGEIVHTPDRRDPFAILKPNWFSQRRRSGAPCASGVHERDGALSCQGR